MATWEPVLEEVMRERAAGLLAYARLLTKDDAEAQDVLQDALVKSFSRGRAFTNVNVAEAYVRRTIPSVFIDRLRRRKAAERAHDRVGVEVAGHEPDRAAVLDVRDALQRLTPRERACIVLRFYDDLTVPAIAERLGLAPGTVKRYLSDASARLAADLGTDANWTDTPDSLPVHAPAMKGAMP
ncbi:sigma-70 family RNA polymerase sigma factor [Demequina globuliformis]|uniref:sigma-70 family RNA polymerase sigma factor n=1 Tax=Demequina globuliformis TaxID=676202 RepID=UPI0007853436|nr:sigma-70 family RNA polymerase sigma factor [Demequina globuliformis]